MVLPDGKNKRYPSNKFEQILSLPPFDVREQSGLYLFAGAMNRNTSFHPALLEIFV